jgi:DNA-binding CsgD family transcriptional regulator/PAS domain-containing protein
MRRLECLEEARISALIGALYEAAASPEHWPEFFAALQGSIRADKAFFMLIDPGERYAINLPWGISPEWQSSYVNHYHQYDVLRSSFLATKQLHGEWVGTNQSVIDDEEYYNSIFYNEFIKPQGHQYQCAAALGGLEGGLEGGILINRSSREGPFQADEVALLATLAPHLRRAVNMNRMLSRQRRDMAALRQGVETLDVAMVSLNSRGRILRMTPAARRILEASDGLRHERGMLRAEIPAEQAKLARLIAGAAATGSGHGTEYAERFSCATSPEGNGKPRYTPPSGGALSISRRAPRAALQLVLTPFSSSTLFVEDRPAALVFIADPESAMVPRSSVLRTLYALSPTEARLADLLAQGFDLTQAAERMRITIGTARFHSKTVFRKTGTHRQTQLVRLVLSLPGAQGQSMA